MHIKYSLLRRCALLGAVSMTLSACGGGGKDGDEVWQKGVYAPAAQFKDRCEVPRSGSDINGRAFSDSDGRLVDEQLWLRSWSHDTYLWYDEIPDQNPASFTTAQAYFDVLKTPLLTASGQPKDKFHFSIPTDEWLQESQSGIVSGYGARFAFMNDTTPRSVRVVYVEPDSPAALAGMTRGTSILSINGVDITATSASDVARLNAALRPASNGEQHVFTFQNVGVTGSSTATLQSTAVATSPVQFVQTFPSAMGNIGYLLFNSHIATAEQGLMDAFRTLEQAGVNELILDLRYNGGGFLDIASQLAYMVAGDAATQGKTFERSRFNDKSPTINPVNNRVIFPTPFIDQSIGFSVAEGQSLPSLNLSRVLIITGENTCSASESVINGLRGIGVEVVQIGQTTCGKPYGFFGQDNCGTTWFTIQFQGVNDVGFGDFDDGFSPVDSTNALGVPVQGCEVADDLEKDFSDPTEARIAAALFYAENDRCPTQSSAVGLQQKQGGQSNTIGPDLELIGVSPALQNRLMSVPGQ